MNKKVLPWILVGASAAVAVFLRMYTLTLPQLNFVAEAEVHEREMAAAREAVTKAAPGLDAAIADKMAADIFKDKLKTDRRRIGAEISRRAEALKERYRDPAGRTYLGGIDSYYWLRLLRNLLERGSIGDRSAGGVEYDDLIGNPIEAPLAHSAHIWLGFVFYKIASFFNPAVGLETPLFYIPLFLTVVIAFVGFGTARRLGASDLGAFAASFVITFSPIFLSRSSVEWFDTDIYSVLFPLLALAAFVEAFGCRVTRTRAIFAALSSFFIACYSSTWRGWWFIFDLMLVSGLLFVLNRKMSEEEAPGASEAIRGSLAALVFLFIFTAIFVTVFSGVSAWKDFILEPLRLAKVLEVTPQAAWPNVYQTVAELGPVKAGEMMNLIGGDIVFLVALGGLLYFFLIERAGRSDEFGFGFLCLIFWIIAGFYTGLAASRFVLLLVVPTGLAFGLAVSRAYRWVRDEAGRRWHPRAAAAARYAAICLFSFYVDSTLWTTHLKLAASSTPAMDDEWQEVLLKIREETPKDAFINSWWDFGHWFKAVARRRVLFDGMTQNTPTAYWMARALLTSDEREAAAILRMINASGNRAADILEREMGFSSSRAVALVREALKMGRQDAGAFLIQKGVSSVRTDELLEALFPKKLPEAYFVVSADMPAKIGPISYIGNWDFERVEAWLNRRNLTDVQARQYSAQMAFLNKEEARRWYSRLLGYASGLAPSRRDEKLLFFDNGLVLNEENNHAFVSGDFVGRRGAPQSIFLLSEDGVLEEIPQANATLPYSALLVRDEKRDVKGLLLDTDFAKSMLARLYYLEGAGLKYFRLFHHADDDKGNSIYVYRIEWAGGKT